MLGRETDLVNDLMSSINMFKLVMNKEYTWTWLERSNLQGFVKKAYELLSGDVQHHNRSPYEPQIFNLVWKATAPKKAAFVAWQLLWKILPIVDNLGKMGMVDGDEIKCSCCGMFPGSADYLFVGCESITKVWCSMMKMVGIVWIAPKKVGEHFWQFSNIGDEKKYEKNWEAYGFMSFG